MRESDKPVRRTLRTAPIAISILINSGCLASSVGALCDVFAIANALLDEQQSLNPLLPTSRFLVTMVGARPGPIAMSSGIVAHEISSFGKSCDVLIVPSIGNCGPGNVLSTVESLQAERELISAAVSAGVRTASVCTGTFLVASTGVLDHQRVTVSWMFRPSFESAYPLVRLQPDQSIVKSDSAHLSSGGVASAYDLALSLISEFAQDEIRRRVAAVLVADASRAPQWPMQNAVPARLEAADVARQAKAWIEKHASEQISASSVANACNVTVRTLARHLRRAFDMTATELVQEARVRMAMQLMQVSQLSFAEITTRCGVSDPATFRKVFKDLAGATPMQYRKKHGNLSA